MFHERPRARVSLQIDVEHEPQVAGSFGEAKRRSRQLLRVTMIFRRHAKTISFPFAVRAVMSLVATIGSLLRLSVRSAAPSPRSERSAVTAHYCTD